MAKNEDSRSAMCVYCGEAIVYDTRQVTDMEQAHKQIVEHDQACPKNPLVARIAGLEKAARELCDQLPSDERALATYYARSELLALRAQLDPERDSGH